MPRRPRRESDDFTPARQARAVAASQAARTQARRAAADPITTDRHYADEEREFLAAMDAYRTRTGRRFPTWCEALAVLRSLGYAKGQETC